jgi:hypothetical protein
MANEIKDKFSTSAPMTISLGSLADGAGRQSAMVDNAAARYPEILVYVKCKMGSSAPHANSIVEVYLIRGDKDATTEHRSDGAGASDAALTPLNAQLIGALRNKASPLAGDVLYGEFVVHRPGPGWGVAIFNRTGQAFDGTGGNHWVRYVGVNPEVQ